MELRARELAMSFSTDVLRKKSSPSLFSCWVPDPGDKPVLARAPVGETRGLDDVPPSDDEMLVLFGQGSDLDPFSSRMGYSLLTVSFRIKVPALMAQQITLPCQAGSICVRYSLPDILSQDSR